MGPINTNYGYLRHTYLYRTITLQREIITFASQLNLRLHLGEYRKSYIRPTEIFHISILYANVSCEWPWYKILIIFQIGGMLPTNSTYEANIVFQFS